MPSAPCARTCCARCATQVAARHDEGDSIVLVTSGAIARGMREMRLPMRPSAMDELQAASAVGQGHLYRAYDDLLRARGVQSAQVLLTFFDLSARTHYLNARHTLERLLAWNVVPVINENDTTTTDEISFGDNDLLAAQVAVLLGADLLVLLTDTAGLYTADPRLDPGARAGAATCATSPSSRACRSACPSSPLGSGGMRSKVVAAEMATAAGIPAQVSSGVDAEAVATALRGEHTGTRFHPAAGRAGVELQAVAALRQAHPRGADGGRRRRAGAARARDQPAARGRDRGGGRVPGRRRGGGARRRRPVGKGIVNYSAAELRQVKGMKTADVRELLPRAVDEAVHRDYFVLD